MITSEQISIAFRDECLPRHLIDISYPVESDVADALKFSAINRDCITAEFWVLHYSALYSFHPDAFIYYLPSLLTCSLGKTVNFLPLAVLLGMLDTSADPKLWDKFFIDRFGRLTIMQCDVLGKFVQSILVPDLELDEMKKERVILTVLMLREVASSH